MLQKNLLFLHTAVGLKNYNEELEFSLTKTFPLHIKTTVFAICILIIILGLIGNGIIFWLLCCTIKKTKFTVYVANLAVADFIALLLSFFTLLQFFVPALTNIFSDQAFLIMLLFGHETNSYFLAAMSTERCLIVFSVRWYQSRRQKCPTAFVCVFLWAISIMATMLDYYFCGRNISTNWNIESFRCRIETVLTNPIKFIILILPMVFSTLAVCIRMKTKPQQDFPTRLDITIWIAVVLHLVFHSSTDIIAKILVYIPLTGYQNEFFYIDVIFYCISGSVNPFVYLLVGCWKWEKGQEPFYLFLERALKDSGNGSVRTQPDQEQA